MNNLYDINEIKKALQILNKDNNLFEVRLIKSKYNASGYFTSVDILISEIKRINQNSGVNFYFTLNKIKDSCYSREQRDKLIEYASPTTSDNDSDSYEWLMIDLDLKSKLMKYLNFYIKKGSDIL